MMNSEMQQQLIDMINGHLSAEDQTALLARFESDPALESEYHLQKEIAHTVIRKERMRLLNEVKDARRQVLSETVETAFSSVSHTRKSFPWFSIAAIFIVAFSILGSYFFLFSEKNPPSSQEVTHTILNGDIQKINQSLPSTPADTEVQTTGLPNPPDSPSGKFRFARNIHRVQTERALAFGMQPDAEQTIEVIYILTKNEKSYVFDDMHTLTILTNQLSDTSGMIFQLALTDDGFESDTLNGFYLKTTSAIYQLSPQAHAVLRPVDLISPRGTALQKLLKH